VELVDRFVAAFNAGDLDALAACLAEDATARVDGAPFPEERGRAAIRETSLPYLLGEGLRAIPCGTLEGWIGLHDGEKRLDVAIEFRSEGDGITWLRYVTAPHRPEELARLAPVFGLRA